MISHLIAITGVFCSLDFKLILLTRSSQNISLSCTSQVELHVRQVSLEPAISQESTEEKISGAELVLEPKEQLLPNTIRMETSIFIFVGIPLPVSSAAE